MGFFKDKMNYITFTCQLGDLNNHLIKQNNMIFVPRYLEFDLTSKGLNLCVSSMFLSSVFNCRGRIKPFLTHKHKKTSQNVLYGLTVPSTS